MGAMAEFQIEQSEKETYGRCIGCGILINEAYGHPETPYEQIMKHDDVLSDEECYECIYDRY